VGEIPGTDKQRYDDFQYRFVAHIDNFRDASNDFPDQVLDWLHQHDIKQGEDIIWLYYTDKSIFCFADASAAMLFRLRFG
jgi:hypothetical protein